MNIALEKIKTSILKVLVTFSNAMPCCVDQVGTNFCLVDTKKKRQREREREREKKKTKRKGTTRGRGKRKRERERNRE